MSTTATTTFVASLQKYVENVHGGHDKIVREVAFDLRDNVVVGGPFSPGTPVDTGFARASWWSDVNGKGVPTSPAAAEGSAGAPSDTVGLQIAGLKAGDVFGLNNGAEYIDALEFGHSGQAPEGMVRVAVAAGQEILDQAVKRVANGLV